MVPKRVAKMPQNIESNPENMQPEPSRRFSVAPMMDRVDLKLYARNCWVLMTLQFLL
jgi:hypothetical protein